MTTSGSMRWSACVAVLLALSQPKQAYADEDGRVLELDRRARDAYDAGRYEDAARLFHEIYRSRPKPAAKFNEALAWERSDHPDLAADAYEVVLALSGLDAERSRAARDRLAELKKVLGYVVVSCPVGATIDVGRTDRIPVPGRFHLRPGARDLTIEQVGTTPVKRRLDVGAGERIVVDLPCTAGSAVSPEKKTSPRERSTPRPDSSQQEPTRSGGAWPWVAFGAAGAFAGAAVFFGLDFRSTNQKYDDRGNRDDDLRSHALRSRLLTNVFMGAAVISAGAGVYLLVIQGNDRRPSAALGIGSSRASAIITF